MQPKLEQRKSGVLFVVSTSQHVNRQALPADGTGWTLHREVALRLKSLSVEEVERPLGDFREPGAFKIRLAGSAHMRGDAGILVQQRYSRKGYHVPSSKTSPNECTFAAYDDGHLAGTLSLRFDSSDGLAVDEIFRAEMDLLRNTGHKICEFIRLAVDATGASKPVLAGLFHTTYLYAKQLRGYDSVVIEVNPRHVGYYRNALGFVVMGGERPNPRIGAPAVLMGMPFEEIARRLHTQATSEKPSARSLYAHGFSPTEEAGVLGRLRALHAN